MPEEGQPIRLNGGFHALGTILKFVVASVTEAELGVLFLSMRKGRVHCTLEELGHPQPAMPVRCDNKTAVGIVDGSVKQQRSCIFKMQYFLLLCSCGEGVFSSSVEPRP